MLFEEGDGGADLAGSAVAALEAIVFEEGGLDGVEFVAVGEAFNGCNLGTLDDGSEGEARVDAAAVDEDGAGAALSVVATLLGAGEREVLTQGIEQGGAGVDGEGVLLAVYLEGERHGLRSSGCGDAGLLGGGDTGQAGGNAGGEDAGSLDEGSAGELGFGESVGGVGFGRSFAGSLALMQVILLLKLFVAGCFGEEGTHWVLEWFGES